MLSCRAVVPLTSASCCLFSSSSTKSFISQNKTSKSVSPSALGVSSFASFSTQNTRRSSVRFCPSSSSSLSPFKTQPSLSSSTLGILQSVSGGAFLQRAQFSSNKNTGGIKVVITGGAGFIGSGLAEKLAELGQLRNTKGQLTPISKIILFDQFVTEDVKVLVSKNPSLFKIVQGSLTEPQFVYDLLNLNPDPETGATFSDLSVFHLAAVLSGHGEDEFDLCLSVNLDGTRNILEGLRKVKTSSGETEVKTKMIFSSTIAVYGSEEKNIVDETALDPLTTYGTTKVCCEKLLADYHRKGFLLGGGCRVPVVVLRPEGNRAASNCFNAVMREPILGRTYYLPTPFQSRGVLISCRNVVLGLIHLHDLLRTSSSHDENDMSHIGMSWKEVDAAMGGNRMMILPSRSFSMQELYDQTLQYAKDNALPAEKIGKVISQPEKATTAIIDSWPGRIYSKKAETLKFPDSIEVKDILDEFLSYHRSHGTLPY